MEEIAWLELSGSARERSLAATVLDHFHDWDLDSFEVPASATRTVRQLVFG